MTYRPIFFMRALVVSLVLAATFVSCGSPTKPSPPTTDSPSIKCPDAVTKPSIDGNPIPVTYTDPVVSGGQAPFTLACTPVSGANFNVGMTTVNCKVTDAVQRTASCTIPVTVVVPPKPVLVATRFVAFGDSMTLGENGIGFSAGQSSRVHPLVVFPSFQTYPGVLSSDLLARYTTQSPFVANEGLAGEKVTGSTTTEPKEAAPARFSRVIAGGHYDVVLIMEGANDLSNRDSRIEPSVIAGLRSMILDAKSRNMRVLLATVPPEQPGGFPDRGLGVHPGAWIQRSRARPRSGPTGRARRCVCGAERGHRHVHRS